MRKIIARVFGGPIVLNGTVLSSRQVYPCIITVRNHLTNPRKDECIHVKSFVPEIEVETGIPLGCQLAYYFAVTGIDGFAAIVVVYPDITRTLAECKGFGRIGELPDADLAIII